MYYLIRETLTECDRSSIENGLSPYVAVINTSEWSADRNLFGFVIDIDLGDISVTKAIVNFDSLTGTFCIPERSGDFNVYHSFAFALDEKGIAFISDDDYISNIIEDIKATKKWKFPSLERFIYDVIEYIIKDDAKYLQSVESTLCVIEDSVIKQETEKYPLQLNTIRGSLLNLSLHYEQLLDMCQEFEENENGFFSEDNLRYFKMVRARIERLRDITTSERDFIVQIRDLIQTQLSEKQNYIMTLLTVITTIFAPLTLITGWYGMNFRYMPELNYQWAYPAVLVLCMAIGITCLVYFKKKKWM